MGTRLYKKIHGKKIKIKDQVFEVRWNLEIYEIVDEGQVDENTALSWINEKMIIYYFWRGYFAREFNFQNEVGEKCLCEFIYEFRRFNSKKFKSDTLPETLSGIIFPHKYGDYENEFYGEGDLNGIDKL